MIKEIIIWRQMPDENKGLFLPMALEAIPRFSYVTIDGVGAKVYQPGMECHGMSAYSANENEPVWIAQPLIPFDPANPAFLVEGDDYLIIWAYPKDLGNAAVERIEKRKSR